MLTVFLFCNEQESKKKTQKMTGKSKKINYK